jgi:UDP:flavonoid glycosyltransferase YjiC (YdhE family)
VRILFTSPSAHGHVQPMIPLAVAAIEAGHDVRWATAAEAERLLAPFAIPLEPMGLTQAERIAQYGRRFPEGDHLVGEAKGEFMFPRLFGAVAATAMADGLHQLVSSWGPDVIVHDAAELAAPAVATAAGVPHAVHAFGFAVPPSRVAAAVDLMAPVWDRLGVEPPPFGGCFDHLYIDIYPPSLQAPALLAHVGRRVGRRPVSGDAAPGEALPASVAALVRSGRRLAYLTFGTVFNVNETFADAVAGLADEGLDLGVIVTVGPRGDADAFGPLPERVVVERYVPQSLLLPHVDVVASHTGSGTALATLALGIPQLCLPQAADQFRNAAAVVGAGAGLSLIGPEATSQAVTTATARLLDEPEHRGGAGRIAEEIATMPSAAEVVGELERLAAPGRA